MPHRKSLFLILIGLILLGSFDIAAAQDTPDKQTPLFVAALGKTKDTWSIVMLDPTADGPEYLTDDEFDEISPIVSTDGRYIVFLRGDFSTDDPLEYYVLDRECTRKCEPKPLPDEVNQMSDLVWSPIEPKLVGWGLDNAVWLIDIEANTVEQIIGGKWNAKPSWSPDGALIVVSSDVVPPDAMLSDDIQIIPAEVGSQEEDRINLTYSGAFVEDVNPHFSPDGQFIAYTTRNMMDDQTDPFYESPYGLLMIDAACIQKKSTCLDTRQLLSKKGQDITNFAWSPDSQYIAYLVSDDPMKATTRFGDLWLVDVASGKTRQLTEDKTTGDFSWSPDSTAVVFERVTDSSYDVYMAVVSSKRDPGPVLTGFRASATPYWAHP